MKVDGHALFVYDTAVNNTHSWKTNYRPALSAAPVASFDFEGAPVTLEITVNGEEALEDVVVRPLARGITPRVEGNVITFRIAEPDVYTVEYNGSAMTAMHIFANPIDHDAPTESTDTELIGAVISEPVMYTYTYVPRTDLSYTVNYLEQGTNRVLSAAKTVNGQTFGSSVRESAIAINGYSVVGDATQTITIAVDGNVINFYYVYNDVPVIPTFPDLTPSYPSNPVGPTGTTITDEETPLGGSVGLNDTEHFAYVIGYDDDTVRPLNNITRAEFASMAAGFMDESITDDGTGDFSDTANHWAASAIRRAAKAGWVTGTGNKFNPDARITRAEVMTIVNRMLDRTPDKDHMLPEMKKWIDNPESEWYYEAVQEATNEHDYERDELNVETWTELLTVRDWKALETEWANNGGASAPKADAEPAGAEGETK